jgi:hypothetical protein
VRRAALLLLLTSLPAGAFAAPPTLEIPAEIRPAGQYARLLPRTDGESVAYVGLSQVEPIPSDVLKDPRLFLLDTRGLAPGRYKFAAVAAGKTGEQTRADFAVVVGDAPPPGPTPPGPTPPAPDDALARSVQSAYGAETDPLKAQYAKGLAALYRQASADAFLSKVSTWGALFDAMRQAAVSTGVSGKLPGVQGVIANELRAKLPTDRAAALDGDGRAKAAALFARAALALEAVK